MAAILDAGVEELVDAGVARRTACVALGRSRASHYRRRRPPVHGPPAPRPPSPRAVGVAEAEEIVELLNSERFCDRAPAQVWATLLDEGAYLASVSTMYRLLRRRAQVRERRRVARRPATVKPELVATAPNQVWSWDITKLAGALPLELVPPLGDPRRLQPLRRGLAGGPPESRPGWPRSYWPRPSTPRASPTASWRSTPTEARP